MGNRLSKIYTRTGDTGTTGLANGDRISKNAPLVIAMGTMDELNSAIGIVLTHEAIPEALRKVLIEVQHKLFDLGGELAMPEYQSISAADIEYLETNLDNENAKLPPLKEFILPGGSPLVAHTHMARAICRRAERDLVTLIQDNSIRSELLGYINRLSDLLFVFGRAFANLEGEKEVLWQHERP